jgi:hypothetical protein
MHGILAASAVSFATGFVLVTLAWPAPHALRRDLSLKIPLALGLGFGASSCLYFVSVRFFGGGAGACVTLDVLALGLALAVLRLRQRQQAPETHDVTPAPTPAPDAETSRLLLGALALAAVIGGLSFAVMAARAPHGGWDAWAIWNRTARFLYRSHGDFRETYRLLVRWAHPAVAVDYPLLAPALVARFWTYAGREALAAPALVGFAYSLSVAWLLVSALTRLHSRDHGLLAGVLLLGTPFFLALGASQLADTPLSFYFLAALVLMALQDSQQTERSLLPLAAGGMIGLACWTKNEGLLFLVSVSIAAAGLAIRNKRAPDPRWICLCLAGMLIPLACVLVCRLDFGFSNRMITNSLQPARLARLLDMCRHLHIWREFARLFVGFGQWPISVSAVLPVYALLAGFEAGAGRRLGLMTLAVVGVQFAGYLGVYLLTPYDLDWHLRTSLDRLLMQWWPSLIFGALALSWPHAVSQAPTRACIPMDSAGRSPDRDDGTAPVPS